MNPAPNKPEIEAIEFTVLEYDPDVVWHSGTTLRDEIATKDCLWDGGFECYQSEAGALRARMRDLSDPDYFASYPNVLSEPFHEAVAYARSIGADFLVVQMDDGSERRYTL